MTDRSPELEPLPNSPEAVRARIDKIVGNRILGIVDQITVADSTLTEVLGDIHDGFPESERRSSTYSLDPIINGLIVARRDLRAAIDYIHRAQREAQGPAPHEPLS